MINTILFWAGVIVAIGAASGVIYKGAVVGSRATVTHVSRRLMPEISTMIASAQAETMEDVMREIVQIKDQETTCHATVMKAIMAAAEQQRIRGEEHQQLLGALKDDVEHLDQSLATQSGRIDDLHNLVTEVAIKKA